MARGVKKDGSIDKRTKDNTRDEVLKIRINSGERERITSICAMTGESISDAIRNALDLYERVKRMNADF